MSDLPSHPDIIGPEPDPKRTDAIHAISERWGMSEVRLILGTVEELRTAARARAAASTIELDREIWPEPIEFINVATYRNELIAAHGMLDPRVTAVWCIVTKIRQQAKARVAIGEAYADLDLDDLDLDDLDDESGSDD